MSETSTLESKKKKKKSLVRLMDEKFRHKGENGGGVRRKERTASGILQGEEEVKVEE